MERGDKRNLAAAFGGHALASATGSVFLAKGITAGTLVLPLTALDMPWNGISQSVTAALGLAGLALGAAGYARAFGNRENAPKRSVPGHAFNYAATAGGMAMTFALPTYLSTQDLTPLSIFSVVFGLTLFGIGYQRDINAFGKSVKTEKNVKAPEHVKEMLKKTPVPQ